MLQWTFCAKRLTRVFCCFPRAIYKWLICLIILVFYNQTMLPFPECLVPARYVQVLKLVLCVPVEWWQKFSSHQRWDVRKNSHLWELTVILSPSCRCYPCLGRTWVCRNTCWRGTDPQGACGWFLHWQNGQAGCLLNILEMSVFFSISGFCLW